LTVLLFGLLIPSLVSVLVNLSNGPSGCQLDEAFTVCVRLNDYNVVYLSGIWYASH